MTVKKPALFFNSSGGIQAVNAIVTDWLNPDRIEPLVAVQSNIHPGPNLPGQVNTRLKNTVAKAPVSPS
jgi:hypothetical protein